MEIERNLHRSKQTKKIGGIFRIFHLLQKQALAILIAILSLSGLGFGSVHFDSNLKYFKPVKALNRFGLGES